MTYGVTILKPIASFLITSRARSLVVSDLRSEIKGSQFESGCQLCAEVSSLQQSPGQCLSVCEAGGSGSQGLKKYPPHFLCSPVIRECSQKKTQIEKKNLLMSCAR